MQKIILGSLLSLGTLFMNTYSMSPNELPKKRYRKLTPEDIVLIKSTPRTTTYTMEQLIAEEKRCRFTRKKNLLIQTYPNIFKSLTWKLESMTREKFLLLNGNIEWANQESIALLENFLGRIQKIFKKQNLPLKKRSVIHTDPNNEFIKQIKNILDEYYNFHQVEKIFNLIVILSDDKNFGLKIPNDINFHNIFDNNFQES